LEPASGTPPAAEDDVVHLDELVARARASVAAGDRARHHWVQQQAAAGATLIGVLTDAAEQRAHVHVGRRWGAGWNGRVEHVGRDLLVLRTDGGLRLLVALRAITSVQVHGGGVMVGDRPAPGDLTLSTALSRLVADRPRIQVHCGETGSVTGTLLELSPELLQLRTDTGDPVLIVLSTIEAVLLA
jgi:hypothetical protein